MRVFRRCPAPTRWRTRVRSRTSLFSGSRIDVDTRPCARERASGIVRSFRQMRRADGRDLGSDPQNSLRLGRCGDDVIARATRSTDQIVSFVNQRPTAQSGSVEGSTLLRKVGGIDQSRGTEAGNLERFWMKAGFEAPNTRLRRSTPDEEPSDPGV